MIIEVKDIENYGKAFDIDLVYLRKKLVNLLRKKKYKYTAFFKAEDSYIISIFFKQENIILNVIFNKDDEYLCIKKLIAELSKDGPIKLEMMLKCSNSIIRFTKHGGIKTVTINTCEEHKIKVKDSYISVIDIVRILSMLKYDIQEEINLEDIDASLKCIYASINYDFGNVNLSLTTYKNGIRQA